MKTIIAGPRTFHDFAVLTLAVYRSGINVTTVISGCADGVDKLGIKYAEKYNLPVATFPVTDEDWHNLGKAAGVIRNTKMAEYAEALIALWDGKSHGTKDMIKQARKRGLKVFVWRTDLGKEEVEHPTLF